jgi:hypothetical protein
LIVVQHSCVATIVQKYLGTFVIVVFFLVWFFIALVNWYSSVLVILFISQTLWLLLIIQIAIHTLNVFFDVISFWFF